MKVLVISENNQLLESIARFESFKGTNVNIVSVHSSLLNASQRIASEVPDIVILDVGKEQHHEFELAERFKTQYKHMTFMMMSEDTSSDLLLKAMRAGFSEVIALPLSQEKFKQALDRYQAKKMANSNHESKVLSFISSKGGSGSTFIATNFAYILAALFKKNVLLIDINQYFGDAAMYVTDKKAGTTLADLCTQMNRLDYAFLESSLIEVLPNYKILAAVGSPESAADVRPEHLDTIIRLARNNYDYIILDAGRQIDAVTLKGLDLSDHVYAVVQLLLPYIRDAKILMNIFKSLGYSQQKIRVIVNRYDSANKIKLTDISGAITVDKLLTIPNEYVAATDSVNQGVSVYRLLPNSLISKALIGLAETVTKTQIKQEGLMDKLFGK